MATEVFGTSGRLMLQALIEGKSTPQAMAELAQKRLHSKIPQLELALEGKLEEHHRFLLKLQLDRLERVESDLAALEQRIQEKLQPDATPFALLQEIPGVERNLAAVIIAELGFDMRGQSESSRIRFVFVRQCFLPSFCQLQVVR